MDRLYYYSRAAQASLRQLPPWQALRAVLVATALAALATWSSHLVLLSPPPAATAAAWEALCVADEVVGRKCLLAVGGLVHKGTYLVSVGGSVTGILAIGQVAVGLVSVGWLSLGALFAAVSQEYHINARSGRCSGSAVVSFTGLTRFFPPRLPMRPWPQGVCAVSPCLVLGLVAFGFFCPSCIVGFTLFKTPSSQGVLNCACVHVPAALSAGTKAKESPRPEHDDNDDDGNDLQRRRRGRAAQEEADGEEEEEWPHERARRGRYAMGA